MASIIKFKRGIESSIPTLGEGEPAFCTDTKNVYVGDGTANIKVCHIRSQEIATTISTDSIICNCAVFDKFKFEPKTNMTINFTNIVDGQIINIEIIGGGDHVLTWQSDGESSDFKWDLGVEPSWSTTTGIDILTLVGLGNGVLAGYLKMKGIA